METPSKVTATALIVKDGEPGTPLWRLTWLANWAETIGHDPFSARGFEATIVEQYEKRVQERDTARREAERRRDAFQLTRDEELPWEEAAAETTRFNPSNPKPRRRSTDFVPREEFTALQNDKGGNSNE